MIYGSIFLYREEKIGTTLVIRTVLFKKNESTNVAVEAYFAHTLITKVVIVVRTYIRLLKYNVDYIHIISLKHVICMI